MRFNGLFGCFHYSFVAWRILIFGQSYSSMIYILVWRIFIFRWLDDFILSWRMYRKILISLFYKKNNNNYKVFILPWPCHLLFWRWSFWGRLVFPLLFVKWLHFVEGLLLIIWFIFLLGEFVSFCLPYDLYSHLRNSYHFAHRMIYNLTWRIWIILLVTWFILPLGEFESFWLSYDLYSQLGNLYHLLQERFLDSM